MTPTPVGLRIFAGLMAPATALLLVDLIAEVVAVVRSWRRGMARLDFGFVAFCYIAIVLLAVVTLGLVITAVLP